MAILKVGDHVKVVRVEDNDYDEYVGHIGIINEINDGFFPVNISFSDEGLGDDGFLYSELELSSNKAKKYK